jgi:hypothetical protein
MINEIKKRVDFSNKANLLLRLYPKNKEWSTKYIIEMPKNISGTKIMWNIKEIVVIFIFVLQKI